MKAIEKAIVFFVGNNGRRDLNYYLVERTPLPEVFQRIIEANEALVSRKAATAIEAAKRAGLSRSAYYKYRDGIRPFFEVTTDCIVTLHFMLRDRLGSLSSIPGLMAESGAILVELNFVSLCWRDVPNCVRTPGPGHPLLAFGRNFSALI